MIASSTARVEIDGTAPTNPLAIVDRNARKAIDDAGDILLASVRDQAPRKTSVLADSFRERVTPTDTGYRLTVAPARNRGHGGATAAEVARWVVRGTGLRRVGPGRKARIRSSRFGGKMRLPSGQWIRSARGQQANPFVERGHTAAAPRVDDVLETGMTRAARELAADA